MNRARLVMITAHALAWSIALPYLCGYIPTYDLWAYLSQGKLFWETGHVPHADTFSYLPTVPWVCHNWLASALTYPLFMAGGGFVVRALTYATMLGAALIAYRTARRADASTLVALLVLVLCVPTIAVGAMPWRPAMLTLLFVALLLAWLQCGRAMWALPLLFVLWANLHAGVVAGLIILTVDAATNIRRPRTEGRRKAEGRNPSMLPTRFEFRISDFLRPSAFGFRFFITCLCAAVTLLNPYGLDYWKMIFVTVGAATNVAITEWQPVVPFGGKNVEFQLLVVFTFAILIAARERDLRRWLVFGAFALMGFHQSRDVPLFGIAALALLPPVAERLIAPWRERWPRVETLALTRLLPVAGFAVAALVFGLWLRSEPWRLRVPGGPNAGGYYYPVGGIEFLKHSKLKGNLAIYFPWGEYAVWKLNGQCRVSADGRYVTVFSKDALTASIDFSLGNPGWRKLLTDYPTDLALVPRGSVTATHLRDERGWKLLYADEGCALFADGTKHPPMPVDLAAHATQGEFP